MSSFSKKSCDGEPVFAEGFFALGNGFAMEGRRLEARDAYRRALDLYPEFAAASCNLGRILRDLGDPASAVDACRHALALRPDLSEAAQTLGAALLDLGQYNEAITVFQSALVNNPENLDLLCNLATALLRADRIEEAQENYNKILNNNPNEYLSWFNLGTLYQRQNKLDNAESAYLQSIHHFPEFYLAIYNLATIYQGQGRIDEAISLYRNLTETAPHMADAHYNLGILYHDRGHLDEAADAYKAAARCHPAHIDALTNFGTVLQTQRRHEEAVAVYREALSQAPEAMEVRVNLGAALTDLGQFEEASQVLGEATRRAPVPEAYWNLALLQLSKGDFLSGWEGYEWRWKTKDYEGDRRTVNQPQWSGEAGGGRTILLYAEQGLGDTIQFCRYIPYVIKRGWQIILEVQSPLFELMKSFANVTVIRQGENEPSYDMHCSLMSLPRAFKTTIETIPSQVPYLRAPSDRVSQARARLGEGVKVGMVWAGNPAHRNDRERSILLENLFSLLNVPKIKFFSLQKEIRPIDKDAFAHLPIIDLSPYLKNFSETAAFIESLDLIISVDTSVAHLAGALGRPTWVLLPSVPDWRWLLEREDSPWYPTMRLFRQKNRENWGDVVARLVSELSFFRVC
ncbi:tetratricopeptide repeat protein [Pararhodospirillum photometricum]|uniref:tetratricopeptide repeat protein n=1 Tax=Pararhodospirillum photometricum TaxID=1084 RepID=UPI0002E971C4|nr:tetratricopeptide repeat protein [Pararhodospirillum photometricum]